MAGDIKSLLFIEIEKMGTWIFLASHMLGISTVSPFLFRPIPEPNSSSSPATAHASCASARFPPVSVPNTRPEKRMTGRRQPNSRENAREGG